MPVVAFIYIVYLIVLVFILLKLRFVKQSGLNNKTVVTLFLCKILVGVFATWYGIAESGDVLLCFNNSISETDTLKSQPLLFFSSIFKSGYGNYDGLYSSHSFWNDLRYLFMDKIMAILNIFSFKNIYVNVLIFNFVVFTGHIALYKVFISLWPAKKIAVIAGCFLLPSSLFFLSTINKDSVFFFSATMVTYVLYRVPKFKAAYLRPKFLLLFFIALLLMFVIRNFFFLAVLLAIFLFYLSTCTKFNPVHIFVTGAILMCLTVLCCETIRVLISSRQNEFLTLGITKSLLKVPVLQTDIKSFVNYLPVSSGIIFFEPVIWHSYNAYYFFCSIEVLFYQLLFITSIFFFFKTGKYINPRPLVLFGLFFSMSALFIIGYTIPYAGAVVRYKSAFLPFLITPLLCIVPYEKFKWSNFIKKNNS
jgi:hypothetical protein